MLAAHSVDTVNQSPSSSVAAIALSLSVLGESAVLSVLALPSLLLMPGLVFVVVLWCLWTFAYPKRSFAITTPAGIESKAAMWVLALLPSLLFPFIYTGIWGIFGKDRDYRRSYGLDDILYLWIMAALLALVVWGIYTAVSLIARQFFIPEPQDDANTVISKYSRRLWSKIPPSLAAKYTVGTSFQTVFVLANRSEGKALVMPLIEWTVKGTASVPEALEEAPPVGHDLWPWLWPRLRKNRKVLDFQYERSGSLISGLTLVDRAGLTDHRPQLPVLKRT